MKQSDPIVENHIMRGGAIDPKTVDLMELLFSKLLVILVELAAKKKREPPTEADRTRLAMKRMRS